MSSRAAAASMLAPLSLTLACAAQPAPPVKTAAPAAPKRAAPGTAPSHAKVVDAVPGSEPGPDVELAPHCPEGMALVRRAQGPYCVDRWEASLVRIGADGKETPFPGNRVIDGIEDQLRAVSVAGRKPQGYISGEQASRVCERSGKRLCEVDEWVLACRGSQLSRYPYGERRRPNVCNDRFKVLDHHPVPILFRKHAAPGSDAKLMWHPSWMNDPRLHEMKHTVEPGGSRASCTNDYGVYDMVGNLHEWVADPDGTFFGGFFMDTFQNGEGCEYRTTAHPYGYHDYSTGFRCCADPEWRPVSGANLSARTTAQRSAVTD